MKIIDIYYLIDMDKKCLRDKFCAGEGQAHRTITCNMDSKLVIQF